MSLIKQLKCLGPGLLYAGAAVGVSHLVQSTRAGAMFGSSLIIVIILSNLLKYPFFQVGPRYTAATGKSLLDGYFKLGKWAVVLFFLLTLATMFVIEGAISVVTAGLLEEVFDLKISIVFQTALLLAFCIFFLIWGRYGLLNKLIKFIIILLSLCTIVSVISAYSSYIPPLTKPQFDFHTPEHLIFLVALIGWMPAPIDISVWHSMWSVAQNKETGNQTSMRDALLDFNIGYVTTAILALGFLGLGAPVMYGRGEAFPNSAAAFAKQLIHLYTQNLGPWAYPVIVIACFTTMFSTTLTVLDAYPRMLRKMTTQLFPVKFNDEECKKVYSGWVLIMAIGTVIFLSLFLENMKAMVDFATILSFVVAPLNALLNYLIMQDKDLPSEAHFSGKMKLFSLIGFIFLTGFSLYFLNFRFSFL